MYNHKIIEEKWKKYWVKNKTFKFIDDNQKEKYYVLDMFPYPSGSGLHVGHPKGYTASDIISRYKRLNGFSVLHPIGWDAFGLPAEQYAISTGNHPKEFTYKNIDNFRSQLQKLGFDFDYDKEVCTCDKKFYKWTQWIFIQLYKNNLASILEIDVNWCENLKIVLSNEEIIEDNNGNYVSERGGHPISKRKMKQWVLKITEFADELLSGLDDVDWTDGLKNIQKKWIGRSEGKIIDFKINKSEFSIPVYIVNIEEIYETAFIVIAADSSLLENVVPNFTKDNAEFINKVKNKKDFERVRKNSEKLGLLMEISCVNPINGDLLPVYIVDYILPNYGHGASIGRPSINEQDKMFANKYSIKFLNSSNNDISSPKYREDICKKLEALKVIKNYVNYKLRDWLFSRQRYWGEPFPILFDENGKIHLYEKLPLELPNLENFSPSGNGESPLYNAKEWLNYSSNGVKYTRDTNTMPQWAGSCWYYIAYILKNDDGSYLELNSSEAKKRLDRWLPVDSYIGGQEHAVLHLLYARFWHRFLYKIGITDKPEPFQRVINQGMILDEKGEKISKSVGNVISVDEICDEYGADSLRLYEMFMGPLTQSSKWSKESIHGVNLWVNKIYRIFEEKKLVNDSTILKVELNKMIMDVTKNIDNLSFNVAISKMMIFLNYCRKEKKLSFENMESFLIILSCFCPFISQEIYEKFLNKKDQIAFRKWPEYNSKDLKSEKIMLPIQINGKVRDIIEIKINSLQNEVEELIYNSIKIKQILDNKKIIRKIFVLNKIFNIIVK